MEEDIKILEEFIKYFEAEAVSIKYRRNISITVGEDDIEALKNLIKGYRELEEWKREKGCSIKEVYELFIPKSKIEDKIEELKETADEDNLDDFIRIQVLEEILKETNANDKKRR